MQLGNPEKKLIGETLIEHPPSTGEGDRVETITIVLDALKALANSAIPKNSPTLETKDCRDNNEKTENEEEISNQDKNYETYLNSLADATNSFSDRCCQFQELLLKLVRKLWSSSSSKELHYEEKIFNSATLHKKISKLEANCSDLENRVKELVRSRDEANMSERRVRKGLYRLASGRMKIGEVLKVVDKDGSSALIDPTDKEDKESQYSPPMDASSSVKVEPSVTNGSKEGSKAVVAEIKVDGKVLGLEDILAMKKKIVDLGLITESRDKQIIEFLAEKEKNERKINDILTKDTTLKSKCVISDEDVKLSSLYTEISSKLSAAEREVRSLKKDLLSVKDRWAVTKGNLVVARKTVDELTEKHYRRLKELAGESYDENNDELYDTEQSPTNGGKAHIENAKKLIELENKLKHALDNVRQVDTVRNSLAETTLLNGELQNRLEELREKNSILLAMKESQTKSADTHNFSSVSVNYKQNKEASHLRESSTSSGSSQEKIRYMKKQLKAVENSKEQAKAKQERAENERDALLKANTRLIKQIQEKDDMNAKSLSKILHLKQLSEQLEQQKDILEKKLKGTKQLEIAARLAANAKERVEEEEIREKESVREDVKRIEVELESSIKEKEDICNLLAQSKAEVATLNNSMSTIRNRCDELVNSSTKNEKEKKNLKEALVIAKKEAAESKREKSKSMGAISTLGKGKGKKCKHDTFSDKNLATLTNVLKNRLACPVCNTNDKQVILLRCRHMFCRQCVDINIKNRSRKCPACAQRFDMKDVADIWL